MKLLFVCTGNTCRSPMAAALARAWLDAHGHSDVAVASSGVSAFEGEPASDGAQRAMQARGLSVRDHQAARLTPELIRSADHIFTMSSRHAEAVRSMAPGAHVQSMHIADPYGGSDRDYHDCAAQIARELDQRLPAVLRGDA